MKGELLEGYNRQRVTEFAFIQALYAGVKINDMDLGFFVFHCVATTICDCRGIDFRAEHGGCFIYAAGTHDLVAGRNEFA